jgi:hypothetical protein
MNNAGLQVDLVDAISYSLDNGALGTIASTGSIKPGQDQQQAFASQQRRLPARGPLAGTLTIQRDGVEAESLPPLLPRRSTPRRRLRLSRRPSRRREQPRPGQPARPSSSRPRTSAREGRPSALPNGRLTFSGGRFRVRSDTGIESGGGRPRSPLGWPEWRRPNPLHRHSRNSRPGRQLALLDKIHPPPA